MVLRRVAATSDIVVRRVPAHLSVDPECATVLLKFNGCNARHLPGLLDVGTVRTNGEAHQVLPDLHLLLIR